MAIKFNNLLLALILMCGLWACKKQVAGPKGETGQPGKNGNANQTSIDNFVLLSQNWQTNTIKKDWNAIVASDLITNDVIQNAEVNIYVNVDNAWMPLPYTKDDFHLQYKLLNGNITMNYFKSHGVANQPASMNFRVIIVSSK